MCSPHPWNFRDFMGGDIQNSSKKRGWKSEVQLFPLKSVVRLLLVSIQQPQTFADARKAYITCKMLLFSQAKHMTKSFIIMGKISSYGKNSHSLFLYLWASVCVLIASWTDPKLKGVCSIPACPSHTGVPLEWGGPGGTACWAGHWGTEAQQFKHDLPLFPSAGKGNLFASQRLLSLTSSNVWEPIINTWGLFWSCLIVWGL